MVRGKFLYTSLVLVFIFILPLPSLRGEELVSGTRVVERGETLTLEGKVSVRGKLLVRGVLRLRGTGSKPAEVDVEGGIPFAVEVRGGKVEAENFLIKGDGGGIISYGGEVKLERGEIAVSRLGVNVSGDSRLEARDVLFHGGKGGVVVRGVSRGTIEECRFEEFEKGGLFVQDGGKVRVSRCVFSGCSLGIRFSMETAGGDVEGTLFRDNGTAILVEKLSAPRVAGNRFTGNDVSIRFTRRGAGLFTGNVFDGDRVFVTVEYSSYPRFRRNDFLRFGEAAVVVRNQSSRWEKEAGVADREGYAGAGEMGKAVEKRLPESLLTGKIDFRENHWGRLTKEMEEGERNISGITDGVDTPSFEYEGREYPLDVVDFSGFSRKPFSEGR